MNERNAEGDYKEEHRLRTAMPYDEHRRQHILCKSASIFLYY